MRFGKRPRVDVPAVADGVRGYQVVCASAASSPFMWNPPRPLDAMIEARQWLEGIRARRAAHEAWEFPSAPTFEPIALAA